MSSRKLPIDTFQKQFDKETKDVFAYKHNPLNDNPRSNYWCCPEDQWFFKHPLLKYKEVE